MKSRGLGFSQVVSTFWIFYLFYLKKAIKVQKSTKSKLGVFLMTVTHPKQDIIHRASEATASCASTCAMLWMHNMLWVLSPSVDY